MPKGSVTVMLSYDYCHFEVSLSDDREMTLEEIDNLRKEANRLADKAVQQYQIMKAFKNDEWRRKSHRDDLFRQVRVIKENYPQSEWTDDQKAIVKAYEDYQWRQYDYQDDWEDEEIAR